MQAGHTDTKLQTSARPLVFCGTPSELTAPRERERERESEGGREGGREEGGGDSSEFDSKGAVERPPRSAWVAAGLARLHEEAEAHLAPGP